VFIANKEEYIEDFGRCFNQRLSGLKCRACRWWPIIFGFALKNDHITSTGSEDRSAHVPFDLITGQFMVVMRSENNGVSTDKITHAPNAMKYFFCFPMYTRLTL